MTRLTVAVLVGLALTWLAGCGGGEGGTGPVVPPSDDGGSPTQVQVGPLLVRPAAAASFVAQEIPNPNGPISFVALYGSRVTYMASQALLDRIVFSRQQGVSDYDIWVCNLDGSNAVRLIDNAHQDRRPAWSPDGAQVAFDRNPAGQDPEIVVMNADGSGPHALTVNSDVDQHPTWSPTGERIAFESNRTGNFEIFATTTDGDVPQNLTEGPAGDFEPDWSPRLESAYIAFSSQRDGNREIYRMEGSGANPTRLTNLPGSSITPAFSPDGFQLAYAEFPFASREIWIVPTSGGTPHAFAESGDDEQLPAWSSDGRFICYVSQPDGDDHLMLRETAEPYRIFKLASNAIADLDPDLGSPVMQTDRVIVGPSGSDWGGYDPIWSYSDAGIAAFSPDGYRNFVRIGVAAGNLPTLEVTPLASPAINGGGGGPVGVVIEAADIVNLREDGGRGQTPVLWQLDPLNATAVLLYFDGYTGKLLSVLVLADRNYPAGTGTPGSAITTQATGSGLVAEGDFAAVFDAGGVRIADAASAVRIAAGEVSVLR